MTRAGRRRMLAAVVIGPLLAVAIFLAATWAPDRPVASLMARWAQPPSQFVDVLGMNVHLRDEGPREDPMPIVLLHGTSASLHTWEGWARALRPTRRVIRLDLPGFGLTGPRPDQRYDLESYTAFMRALFDRLGVQSCVLGGNSFGGNLAWKTALVDARVRKLVLVDAGGYPNPNARLPLGFRLASTPIIKRFVAYSLPRSVVERSVRSVYGDPSKVTPELVDLYFDLAVREGNRAAVVKRFEQARATAHEEVAAVGVPTLIVWGGRDELVTPEFAARFHRDIRGSELVIFDELGHVPHEEAPETTVAPVVAFVAR
jgi:pimeloyl-ACP methyl ester carboxylesterase